MSAVVFVLIGTSVRARSRCGLVVQDRYVIGIEAITRTAQCCLTLPIPEIIVVSTVRSVPRRVGVARWLPKRLGVSVHPCYDKLVQVLVFGYG